MRFAVSLAFWFYFALSSAVLFCLALVLWLLTLPFDRNGRVLHLYTCAWAAHYLYINPLWRVRVSGNAAVDRGRAYVIVSNHQSFGDILAISATYLPFKWVSKQSVFKVPFLGWNCTLNRYVPIVRGDKQSAEAMFATCRRWIERGVSIVMFPEGTRSTDGEIHDFKIGAFRIAHDTGAALLPVIVDGTGDALPKHGIVLRHNVDATVRVLPPVEPRPGATPEETSAELRALMIAELAALRGKR